MFLHQTWRFVSCCRFDHLFGMFRTSAGKVRRIDLIFVPKPEFAFGYLGWVRGLQLLQWLSCSESDTAIRQFITCDVSNTEAMTCYQVGSRQFLRFLRQHAANRNMHLNSHRRGSSGP